MKDIDVDGYGIKIMLPKAVSHLVKLDSVSNITANILKQEMLSLGGDVAVARGALTGQTKKTGCLLMGTLSHFNRLHDKLARQPFGLDAFARELSLTLDRYRKDDFTLSLGKYRLNLGVRAQVMGILNVTPDSFSGDGLLRESPLLRGGSLPCIVDHAQRMVRDGADILDVGGESSRPNARPVALKEELARVIPVIKALARKTTVPISIDTFKPEVAKAALDNGALLINDITGLRNPKMVKLAAREGCGVVIMHMKGTPRTMQRHPEYDSLIDDIIVFLEAAIRRALDGGVRFDKIVVDPGIGFGKNQEHNLAILKSLSDFKALGRPILVGPSRKAFLGNILRVEPQERVFGTVAACTLAIKNGAKIVRVHDVRAVKQALSVFNAINNA
jgi:dihydropteroate synthase